LSYAEDVIMLNTNKYTIKKNTEAPLEYSKQIGLEVNTKNAVYKFTSHHHAGR